MTEERREAILNQVLADMVWVKGGSVKIRGRTFELADYQISKYLVTQEVWEAVTGEPCDFCKFKGARRPVETISFDQIFGKGEEIAPGSFLGKINAWLKTKEENPKTLFRLPSEVQWEYAAIGGHNKGPKTMKYSGSQNLEEVGWFKTNSHFETKPLGMKMPTVLGLYDVSGNVEEWCQDSWEGDWGEVPLPRQLKTDGLPYLRGDIDRRVVRGGSWIYNDSNCSISFRNDSPRDYLSLNIGFRLARY